MPSMLPRFFATVTCWHALGLQVATAAIENDANRRRRGAEPLDVFAPGAVEDAARIGCY